MNVLYLGTDPSRYVCADHLIHYPIIQTIPIVRLEEDIRARSADCTFWLFTSPNAVRYWWDLSPMQWEGKEVYAVGPSTAACLAEKGLSAKTPVQATQEGLIELLECVDLERGSIAWPRSSLARPILSEYLNKRKVRYVAIDLYHTVFQRLEPVPDLEVIDEIVFTSPSTVRAFIEIFGEIPQGKKITSIGPVTKEALTQFFH